MRRLVLIALAALTLSCGAAPMQTSALRDHLVMKCRLVAACLPPFELHGMTPNEFCDWLDNLGELAEFVEECEACQIK
jgi:hypothetical protein